MKKTCNLWLKPTSRLRRPEPPWGLGPCGSGSLAPGAPLAPWRAGLDALFRLLDSLPDAKPTRHPRHATRRAPPDGANGSPPPSRRARGRRQAQGPCRAAPRRPRLTSPRPVAAAASEPFALQPKRSSVQKTDLSAASPRDAAHTPQQAPHRRAQRALRIRRSGAGSGRRRACRLDQGPRAARKPRGRAARQDALRGSPRASGACARSRPGGREPHPQAVPGAVTGVSDKPASGNQEPIGCKKRLSKRRKHDNSSNAHNLRIYGRT